MICYRLKLDSEARERWLADPGLEFEKVLRSVPVSYISITVYHFTSMTLSFQAS